MRRYVGQIGLILLVMVLASCQASPPTVVYIVLSPTPEADASPEASLEADASATTETPTESATATEAQPATPMPATVMGAQSDSATPTSQPTAPAATPMPANFPTQTVAQIQVAEQVFEGGRMMWLQPVAQIWVLEVDDEGSGSWLRFEDNFVDGEDIDTDPSIVPPEGMFQPERGFGKLWRENDDLRDALGWAITPEFGYISQYEYIPDGQIVDDEFVPGFGHHVLFSLNGEAFSFLEESERWILGRP
jgi:hypothetical protein